MPPRTVCTACGSTRLLFVREQFDEIDRVYVGTVLCADCRASLLYQRRPNEPLPTYLNGGPMAKPRDGYPKAEEPKKRGRPRQQDLIEDRAIKPLEDAAAEYAELRDERMRLTEQEVGLKAKLLSLMKKHSKTTYDRDGIHIEIVTEDETVKVRVKKVAQDAADAEDAGEQAVQVEVTNGSTH